MSKKVLTIILIVFVPLFAAAAAFIVLQWYAEPVETLAMRAVELEDQQELAFSDWLREQQQKTKQLKEEKAREFTLFVAGDIMMARTVETKMLEKNDFSYCLADMRPVISGADFAVANLESPIVEGATTPVDSTVFRAHPKSAEALALAGFDAMNVANNHFGDQGAPGISKTIDYLEDNGIAHFGGGQSQSSLVNPLIREIKNIKVAFLGYGYGPDYYGVTEDRAGMALMDPQVLVDDLQKAREQADVVIVTFHDGVEYEAQAGQHQRDFAHLAVDNGADFVFGHHPHVVQDMEIYNEKYIFYSLGNFVFDQMWSQDTRRGLGLMLTIDENGVKDLDYHPVVIDDYCRPRPAQGLERDAIIDRL